MSAVPFTHLFLQTRKLINNHKISELSLNNTIIALTIVGYQNGI